jgi:hypothetical protein
MAPPPAAPRKFEPGVRVPPSLPMLRLPVKVHPTSVAEAALKMDPPSGSLPLPAPTAWLPTKVLHVAVRVPPLSTNDQSRPLRSLLPLSQFSTVSSTYFTSLLFASRKAARSRSDSL